MSFFVLAQKLLSCHMLKKNRLRGWDFMPDRNWYETSEDLLMPLPLTEEEAKEKTDFLTQERKEANARRFPSITLPNNTNITVIPMIPGITLFGYIRFLNASPVETRVDIYANGRKVASDLRYQDFTEYMKALPGWYRIAVYRAGTITNPLAVLRLQVRPVGIDTVAVTGLAEDLSATAIADSRRRLNDKQAYIRFVQLSPTAPAMDVYWDERMVLSDLRYGDVSRYLTTTPGKHSLKLRDSKTGEILVEHPKVILKGGKAYTVYVVGSRADRAGLQVLIPLEGTTYLDFGN